MYCLIPESFPPKEGGVETYLLNVSESLATRGVCVLAPWQEGCEAFDSTQHLDIQRIHAGNDIQFRNLLGGFSRAVERIVRQREGGRRLTPQDVGKLMRITHSVDSRHMVYILQVFSRLAEIQTEVGIDVLHIGTVLPSGAVGLWARQFFGIPFVPYVHAAEINYWQRFPKGKELLLRTLEESARIVAVCEYARSQLLVLGIEENKIVKICPGVDSERFSSEAGIGDIRRRYGLDDKVVILTVSHLVARKGHDTVLKALPALVKEFPNIVYLVVGRGPYRAALEALALELGLQEHVIFAGYVDGQNLSAYYNICDIFAMVSREIGWNIEGFGIVYIEASAAGKPIVAGRSGGTADAVIDGDTGILVDPESHTEVARALRRLLRSRELRRKLGQNGRERVKRMFSWERVRKEIEELNLDIEERNRHASRD